MEMIRRLSLLAVLIALASAGCAYVGNEGIETKLGQVKNPVLWLNLEVASLVVTKKTMFDHVATWVTGRDCSTPRAEREGVYCVDWPEPPSPPPQVYCYASLGRPSCFAQPYNEGNDRLIGFVPAAPPVR